MDGVAALWVPKWYIFQLKLHKICFKITSLEGPGATWEANRPQNGARGVPRTKKTEKVPSRTPPPGLADEPFLHLGRHILLHSARPEGKRTVFFGTPVAGHFLSQFFGHFGEAYSIKNSSFTLERLRFSTFHRSQILHHLGFHFGGRWAAFWHPFGTTGRHWGAPGRPRWPKVAPKNSIKK